MSKRYASCYVFYLLSKDFKDQFEICTGWWLNLVYLNNFGKDITGKTGYDCVNVSWYMAIDMQYFVLSPILLTIYWRKPIAGG